MASDYAGACIGIALPTIGGLEKPMQRNHFDALCVVNEFVVKGC
jgi:hypothetical protein